MTRSRNFGPAARLHVTPPLAYLLFAVSLMGLGCSAEPSSPVAPEDAAHEDAAHKDAASAVDAGSGRSLDVTSDATAADVQASDSQPAPSCIPSEAVYNKTAAKLISNACGNCHGATPDFGAPMSLTGGYASLIKGEVGKRLVDRIAVRMANKTMPPVGTPPIEHVVQDTVVEWASCGEKHPDHTIGLVADKPVFTAPKSAPKGVQSFDLTAGGFAVGEHVLDLYQCFTFEVPVQSDRFVRRMEVLIDQSKVLHHVVLLRDPKKKFPLGLKGCKNMPSGSQYLYAWAPGAGAIEFPEGGMRLKPKERYILQIHYNNGAGIKGAKDSSGVRIYHGPPTGTEYGMVAPGPLIFSIPGHSTTSSTGHCTIKEKMTILAGMPHMHELGSRFKQEIVRKNGKKEPLISLTGWSFEMQPFYAMPATLNPGDRLETTCTWKNTTGKSVSVGPGTADEMCFNFMFVTPPPKNAYCDNFSVPANPDVAYKPGACALKSAVATPAKVTAKLGVGVAPSLTGGAPGKQHWLLTSGTVLIPAFAKDYLDLDKSMVIGRGQAWTDGNVFTMDTAVRVLIDLKQGGGADTVDIVSRSGPVTESSKAGTGTWKPTCGGGKSESISWQVKGEELVVRLNKSFAQFTVPAVYRFVRMK